VRSALANFAWEVHDAETASTLAQSVVTESTDASREWVDAVSVLAEVAFVRQDFVRARAFYEQLAAARYDSRYWFYLGLCEQNCGDTDAAIRALVKSLEVDPVQTGAHDVLAILYQNRGDHSSEMAHRQASGSMQRYLRQFRTSIHERVAPLGLEPEQN
jgi:Tfp pilus assembly protein PilF